MNLGKVVQMVKDKRGVLENVEVSVPGVDATKLVTVSRAIFDENKAVAGLNTTVASAAVDCEYFMNFARCGVR